MTLHIDVTSSNLYDDLGSIAVQGPVVEADRGAWLVTGNAEARRIFNHPTFCRVDDASLLGILKPALRARLAPPRMAELETMLRKWLRARLDASLKNQETFDLLEQIARPLTCASMRWLFGLSVDSYDELDELLRPLGPHFDNTGAAARDPSLRRAVDRARDYFFAMAVEEPLITRRELRDAGLSTFDVAEFMLFVTLAGYETTVALLGTVATRAIEHARTHLPNGTGEIRTFVEECLRFEPPVQIDQRVCAEDVVIDGWGFSAGDIVAVLVGATNRDPGTFHSPDYFVPSRWPNPHLTFGLRPHFCVGAPLARLESALLAELVWPVADEIDIERTATFLPRKNVRIPTAVVASRTRRQVRRPRSMKGGEIEHDSSID